MEILEFGKFSDLLSFNFGKLTCPPSLYYYNSKKGGITLLLVLLLLYITLGFCAGLPAGDKSLIIFPPASRPATNHK